MISIFACKTAPPLAPQNVDSATVLACMELKMFFLGLESSQKPDVLYCVQLARFDGPVPSGFKIPRLTEANLPTSIIQSTYRTRNGVYWLSAPPGAYAQVGASYSQKIDGQKTSTPMSNKGTVTVTVARGTRVYVTFFPMGFPALQGRPRCLHNPDRYPARWDVRSPFIGEPLHSENAVIGFLVACAITDGQTQTQHTPRIGRVDYAIVP